MDHSDFREDPEFACITFSEWDGWGHITIFLFDQNCGKHFKSTHQSWKQTSTATLESTSTMRWIYLDWGNILKNINSNVVLLL